MFRTATLLVALAATSSAATLEFELKAGSSRLVTLESPVDDSHFRDPVSYAEYGAGSRRFTRRVELTNTGDGVLSGRLLVVNGRDFTNADALVRTLGLSVEPERQGVAMRKLFTFWTQHRSHAGSWAKLANEPFAALNFWGYSLCGDDTQALARLAAAIEVPARHVELNGHVAAEYRYDSAWHMMDGDTAACYLRLDNETLAGAAELRADPFLILRSRVFGRFAPLDPLIGAINASRLEHVKPGEPRAIKIKTAAAPLNVFTLQPGEMIAWLCDTPPEKPVGRLTAEKPADVRTGALATIEHRVAVGKYALSEDGTITVGSPFPIVKAVNQSTGATFAPAPGEVVFKAQIAVKGAGDRVSIFSQCSRLALPLLSRGENSVRLDAAKGEARVAVEYEPLPVAVVPEIEIAAREGADGSPGFAIVAKPVAERLWWQVATSRDFSFVAPSLEGVTPFAADFRLDPLTDTFLSSGRTYFIRAKANAAGVWSAWSDVVEFRVKKPRQPVEMKFTDAGRGRVRLSWSSPAKNAEFLVFGSNRIDFMPEVFSGDEVVAAEDLKVTERRPNKNLLAETAEQSIEFLPAHRFYRVIARREGVLSVPGELVRLPEDFAATLPPALVLQTRAKKVDGKDVYRAEEEPLPLSAPEPK